MNAVDIATLPRIAAREFLCGEVLALDAASGAAQLRYRVKEMHSTWLEPHLADFSPP